MTVSCFNVKIAMCHLPISPHSQKAATSSMFPLLIPLWPITQCSAGRVKFSKELLGYSYGKMIPLHLRFGPHNRKVLLLWWDVGRGVRNGINGRLGTQLFSLIIGLALCSPFFSFPVYSSVGPWKRLQGLCWWMIWWCGERLKRRGGRAQWGCQLRTYLLSAMGA